VTSSAWWPSVTVTSEFAEFVVVEIVADVVALVPEAEDELGEAGVGEPLHDVPEDGRPPTSTMGLA